MTESRTVRSAEPLPDDKLARAYDATLTRSQPPPGSVLDVRIPTGRLQGRFCAKGVRHRHLVDGLPPEEAAHLAYQAVV